MKATKKIVGATAALVAAVALSAGSTFAWFVANGTATVSGMDASVTSARTLEVSSNGTEYLSNISLGTLDLSNALPCSTEGISTGVDSSYDGPDFYALDKANDQITIDNGVVTNETTSTFKSVESGTTTYQYQKLYLRYNDSAEENTATTNLNVTVTIGRGSASSEIDKSLRVLLIVEGTSSSTNYWFALADYDNDYLPISSLDGDNTPVLASATPTTFTTSGTKKTGIGTLTNDQTPIIVHMYFWYEGQDANCSASDLSGAQGCSITVAFDINNS